MTNATMERSSAISTETVNCPICAGADTRPWGAEDGWTVVQCVECNCIYVNPRPVSADVSESAKTGLHPTESGLRNMIEMYKRGTITTYRTRMAEIFTRDELRQPNLRWLDVGAGYGQLVMGVRQLLGSNAKVEGLEPSERKRSVARKHGLELHPGTLEEFSGEAYDIISMCNVLSHLPVPRRSITQIRGLLRPGGRLVLLTGNMADCAYQDCPGSLNLPDHLLFVGKKTLHRLLTEAGFEIETIKEYKEFFPENEAIRQMKNVVKRVLRRPIRTKNRGPFRDLLVKARVRA